MIMKTGIQQRSKYFLKLLLPLLGLVLANSGWAKSPMESALEMGIDINLSYEATRLMETKDGSFSFKERIAPQKRAIEMETGGMSGLMVIREDQQRAFFMMPEMGMYREMKFTDAMQQSNQSMETYNIEKVGRENVEGYDSTKYKTKFKDPNGKGAGFIWVADEGFAVKMDMIYASRGMKGERMTITMKDVKLEPQDPSHFELTPGLKPFGIGSMLSQFQAQEDAQGTTQANQTPGQADAPPTITEEMGDFVKEEVEEGAKSSAKDKIARGIRGLFRK